MRFNLAIHKDEGSIYGVTVPDLPGCFSSGQTIDDAIDSAREAIISHIETALELGMAVDISPKKISEHMQNPDFQGAIWAVVDVNLSELDAAPSRFNVSMPRFVLAKIDRYVDTVHDTRSGFLARAALETIEREKQNHAA